ncbi:MAG: NADH-quinone oxidoreductase subunit M [Chloroflexi bacterium]|nr:NADH-quinone oxidoreductase subunit M [Chloroflexota bacterium]
MLSLMIFVPLIGAAIVLFLPERNNRAIKWVALLFSVIPLLMALYLAFTYNFVAGAIGYEEYLSWIPNLNVNYHLGVDGISLPLVLLISILTPLVILYSFTMESKTKAFFILLLMQMTGTFGVFLSLDLFLFFLFWEISVVPMYFIINSWGGPNRRWAAIKFFIYTMAGSIAMLMMIQLIFLATNSFDIVHLSTQRPFTGNQTLPLLSNSTWQALAFLAFFLAFAIKVPLFPLHTWFPEAYTEAPDGGTALLSGLLAKMGVFGFIRIVWPLFPEASAIFAPIIGGLALVNIIYGAFAALAQTDLKRMLAYSSFNHMGFMMLGLAAAMAATNGNLDDRAIAVNGTVLQMFNHGITTGALFLLVGVLFTRTGLRDMRSFGGLGTRVPIFAGVMLFSVMSSLGLPGLNNFWGEFLIMRGVWASNPLYAALATIGLVLTALYLLRMMKNVFFGPLNSRWNTMPDMDRRELFTLVPLMAVMVLIGFIPATILDLVNRTVVNILSRL